MEHQMEMDTPTQNMYQEQVVIQIALPMEIIYAIQRQIQLVLLLHVFMTKVDQIHMATFILQTKTI